MSQNYILKNTRNIIGVGANYLSFIGKINQKFSFIWMNGGAWSLIKV
jgi:hypothetical protein